MTPIELNIDFILVRDGQAKPVKALGIVPEGIYYQTDRTALVSGRLIKAFAHWEELECPMLSVKDMLLKIEIDLAIQRGCDIAAVMAIQAAAKWLNSELKGDNIEGCRDADALENSLMATMAGELYEKIPKIQCNKEPGFYDKFF